jgi:hypothetical protein
MLFVRFGASVACDWLENQNFERRVAGTFLRRFPRIKRTGAPFERKWGSASRWDDAFESSLNRSVRGASNSHRPSCHGDLRREREQPRPGSLLPLFIPARSTATKTLIRPWMFHLRILWVSVFVAVVISLMLQSLDPPPHKFFLSLGRLAFLIVLSRAFRCQPVCLFGCGSCSGSRARVLSPWWCCLHSRRLLRRLEFRLTLPLRRSLVAAIPITGWIQAASNWE